MASRRHYVIYVPGIRDDLYHVQFLLIQCWRLWGVRPVLLTMPWAGEGAFEPKIVRLISRVDAYVQQGYKVSLVGASAGASAVLNAYVQRREEVRGVVYICGKINYPDTVSAQTYAQNQAFKTSMQQLQNNLSLLTDADKRKLTSFYSSADTTVPYTDTVIEGVLEQKLPLLGHMWSILYAISVGSGKLLQTLKK